MDRSVMNGGEVLIFNDSSPSVWLFVVPAVRAKLFCSRKAVSSMDISGTSSPRW